MAERTPSTPRTGPFIPGVAAPTNASVPPPHGDPDLHPVEVVGRIREHPDGRGEPSVLQALPNGRDLRITSKEHQQGYRIFSLDGVSKAENESLEAFYLKYAEARVDDVKVGGKCTIMMYGPTGAGKSHTMFGSGSERGVAYHALIQIMGEALLDGKRCGNEVKASVWEIFNEDIYDLLAQTNHSSGALKGQLSRVKLDVKGKKVRNSTYINDYDPNRLLKEIQKIEKKRVTKATNCNDRSSRSHCIVTFEVPAVNGRLVLVDMAGSENLEQAGVGVESKLQTGKINQGNRALKRVVEAIANGENYIPYRDSKLTMILQESFEDKNAKVLMILCASPDPRDLFKTLGTFEYGAKAKKIVRLPNSPAREKIMEEELQKLAVVNAKEVAKDMCIQKLRREKERSDRDRETREREAIDLRRRVDEMESQLNVKKVESDSQLVEWRRQADLEHDLSRRRVVELEQKLQQTVDELEVQKQRAEKAETELNQLRRMAFSNFENNPDSANWGHVKQQPHKNGLIKGNSSASKVGSLGQLAIENSKTALTPYGGGNVSIASPKEKKEKKFSSSVLSFFKGSDSAHNSKKTQGKIDTKAKDSPGGGGANQFQHLLSPKSSEKADRRKQVAGSDHALASPRSLDKSDRKRLAGQEAPSPKTAEKKRNTSVARDAAGMAWQPSTLQELLKAREEEQQQQLQQEKCQASEMVESPSRTKDDAAKMNLSSQFSNSLGPIADSKIQAETGGGHDLAQANCAQISSNEDKYQDDDIFLQVEKDPLGFGTFSESKLHRKGWLPIIVEERDDELERLARKSLEEATKNNRISLSCPRLRDSATTGQAGRMIMPSVCPSQEPTHVTAGLSTDGPDFRDLLPSNLLRDKFPSITADEDTTITTMAKQQPVIENANNQSQGAKSNNDSFFSSTLQNGANWGQRQQDSQSMPPSSACSPIDSFLQRLGPSFCGTAELDGGAAKGDTSKEAHRATASSQEDVPQEAASARKARIENIFMLCGHRREMAARTGAESPLQTNINEGTSSRSSPQVMLRENSEIGGGEVGGSESVRSQTIRGQLFKSSSLPRDHHPPLPPQREHHQQHLYPPPMSPYSASASPLPPYRERDNQSHLSLEVDALFSPARSPFRTTLTPVRSFEGRLRSPPSPEMISSASSSPLLPVLPSPQKSDSPSRHHRKFRTGNLFQFKPEEFKTDLSLSSASQGTLSPTPSISVRRTAPSPINNENVDLTNVTGSVSSPDSGEQECDVYVKWESKDTTTGKLIGIIKISMAATLAELRKEIIPQIPISRESFTFLMLGDAGGAPVEQELECDLRVSSLPDCPGTNGNKTRLASLRPPITHKLYTPQSRPFRSIENTMGAGNNSNNDSSNLTEHSGLIGAKVVKSAGPKHGGFASARSNQNHLHHHTPGGNNGNANSNSSSLAKGLRSFATGVGLRGGQSLKERGSSAAVQEIASRALS